MTPTPNRRRFLGGSLAAACGMALDRGLAADAAADAAAIGAGKRVGLIGTGWYGKCDLLRLLQVAPVEVVALCDVDRRLLEEAGAIVAGRQPSRKQPRLHRDFREMLAPKDLDLVLVATPDHWHALPAIAAMEAGADVYLQKPISVDVREGGAILDAARRLGRVVQVGTQRRSTPHLVEAKRQFIDSGRLGAVGHVEMWCFYPGGSRDNPPDEPPPDGLDWELWCGPAPLRPFNRRIHPRGWRSFREFGNGIIGDMGIHMLDAVRWLLGAGWPRRISSHGGRLLYQDGIANVPDTQVAVFDFGAFNAVWTHRNWGTPVDPDFPWAAVIYGEKGTLKLSVHRFQFVPRGDDQPVTREVAYELDEYPEDRTEPGLEKHVAPAIRYHLRDWLAAVARRGQPVADIEQGYISSTCCILANLALDLGRSLAWDPATRSIPGDDEANARLARPYRAPWQHPAA